MSRDCKTLNYVLAVYGISRIHHTERDILFRSMQKYAVVYLLALITQTIYLTAIVEFRSAPCVAFFLKLLELLTSKKVKVVPNLEGVQAYYNTTVYCSNNSSKGLVRGVCSAKLSM